MSVSKIFKVGSICQGKKFNIVESKDSCLRDGKHVVAVLLGEDNKFLNHQELTLEEMSAVFIETIKFCRENSIDDKWKIVLNGTGLLKAPWFHIHGIMPSSATQILREVWRPTDHLKCLKDFSKKLVAPLNDEFQNIINNFENNLK